MPTPYELARNSPQTRRFASFSPLAASTKSVLRLPMSEAYLRFCIQFKIGANKATDAQIATQVTNVQLQVDSDLKVDASAAELQMIHDFYRGASGYTLTADKGQLWIHLARPWHRELEGEDGPQWGLLGKRNFDISFTLGVGATIDSAVLYAETVAGEELGRHICLRRFNYNTASTGPFEIANLPLDPSKGLYAIHINETPETTIDTFSLRVENRLEWDAVPIEVIISMMKIYGRKPSATWTQVDFCRRGRHADALPLVTRDAILLPNFAVAPNAFVMLAEIAEVA